jgi:hypothetical protein
MGTRTRRDWGNDASNPLLEVRDRLEKVREYLPADSHWRDQDFILALSTFSYHCWSSPYSYFNDIRKDIQTVADELKEDLKLAYRAAQGEQPLRESPASWWIMGDGTHLDLDSVHRHLHRKGDQHTLKVEKWRVETAQQRERLAPALGGEQEEIQKAWDKETAKQIADREADKRLDAQMEDLDKDNQELQRAHERKTLENPTAVSPRSHTADAGPRKSAPTAQNQPTEPSRHKRKLASRKLQRQDGTPPTVAGPSHLTAPAQSLAPSGLRAPAPLLSAEPWKLPTPEWAKTYRKGMLGHLGLVPGRYGKQGNDVITPPNKVPRPEAGAGEPDRPEPNPMKWPWGLYTILARMPGGKAKLNVLYGMCLEWCPTIEPKNESCRHCLSSNGEYFFSENNWWRLSDIGEERIKRAGPKKGVRPQDSWRKAKTSTQVSETKTGRARGKQVETVALEEPSMHDRPYGRDSGHMGERQAPVFSSYQEIDAAYPHGQDRESSEGSQSVSPTPTNPLFSQLSAASSPQSPPPPTGDRRLSVAVPASERQFTPINRPASVPRTNRTLLPSVPAKRKCEDEDFEQAKRTIRPRW